MNPSQSVKTWHNHHMAAAEINQVCSEPGCDAFAAFRTRTHPAWCDEHVSLRFQEAGVMPIEPFTKPESHRLCRCTSCGVETHIRLPLALERASLRGSACDACGWREWAVVARNNSYDVAVDQPVDLTQVEEMARRSGYDYLGPLTEPSLPSDPHHVRCKTCGRLAAKRVGDIGWGCSCRVNPRRENQQTRTGGKRPKRLLKTESPEAGKYWDGETNDPILWQTLSFRARRDVSWKCPECHHRWTASPASMSNSWGCPECARRRLEERTASLKVWEVTPVAEVPELMRAWDEDEVDPRKVMVGGSSTIWNHTGGYKFKCENGHRPRIMPLRYLEAGCPSCRGAGTRRQREEAAARDPDSTRLDPELASQWHPTKNEGRDLALIGPDSRAKVWWLDRNCGHEWQETPKSRGTRFRFRCPFCETILDSLAWHYPELAQEWSQSNPTSPWHIRPTADLKATPEWICSRDPAHVWQATASSRAQGGACPECVGTGKSAIELQHHQSAFEIFGNARSGVPIHDDRFKHSSRWLVDIACRLPSGVHLVIEYDGSYWHAGKLDVDAAKSLDLLAADYAVARLREYPLAPLGLDHPRYAEFTVHAKAPDPSEAIRRVQIWAEALT